MGPTGRVVADARVFIIARDTDLVSKVGDAIASIERLHVDGVAWHVDADNEAWRGVRADAIAAAIAKARDYAVALGGRVTAVEHVADAGLLTPGNLPAAREMKRVAAAAAGAEEFGGSNTPSLAPVPQELHAVVEVRLSAEIPQLT